MKADRNSLSMLLLLAAFVFFLLAALIAGGVITASAPWLWVSGLAAWALSALVSDS